MSESIIVADDGSGQADKMSAFEPSTIDADRKMPLGITTAFFASGFSALIYQVVWQRVLFTTFGINIEAVTVVVTAFLAGLGAGSLIGGRISRRDGSSLLKWFAACELLIGAYGLISVALFRKLAILSIGAEPVASALITSVLVFLPTLVMGVTLPLLVAHVVQKNVRPGPAIGRLYFVNTAGSSLAALATAAFLLRELGEARSTALAALINLVAGLTVLILSFNGSVKR